MNKPLRRVTFFVFLMFAGLLGSTSMLQVLQANELNSADGNTRTLYASFSTQRGAIIAGKDAIASSSAVDDRWQFLREYSQPLVYAPLTGYFTLTQGMTGLEYSLNEYLTGSSGAQFFEQVRDLFTGQSAQGASVTLTIDPDVQQAAYDALGDNKGSIVAYEPSTGKILALVSKPSFDPNALASHDTAQVIAAYNELLADPDKPLVNRAISGDLYHPGSTFKLVMAAAALEAGYTPESTFDNPSELTLPQSTSVIRNASQSTCGDGETVTLATALRLSCNIPFAELGQELGYDTVSEMAEAFGFGETVQIPMTATASIFPETQSDAQLMLSSFGQFDVRVTPLQMAMISAGIANGGTIMTPNVVSEIRSKNLETLESFEPSEFASPISAETAKTLTEMMIADVDTGVASGAKIDGVSVAGKTGTAENGEDEPYTLWFTGFAPADNPQVAVAVVVEDQELDANVVAAPMARTVMEAVLNR